MKWQFTGTEAEWANIIDEFEKSGQTMTAWCNEHGINVKTMGNHTKGRALQKSGTQRIITGKPQSTIVKRSADEWTALIQKQKLSGMNRDTWCKEHGINPNAMTSAEKRHHITIKNASTPEWVELSPGAKKSTSSPHEKNISRSITVRIAGLEIDISADYPIEKLVALIGRLAGQC